jgi:hypothetical protein
MTRTGRLSLAAVVVFLLGCPTSPKDASPTAANQTLPQRWEMISQDGQIATVLVTPFVYSGTFSETSTSAGWFISWPGGKARIPLTGTIAHTSRGDHWSFSYTIMTSGVSLLGSGEAYSNGNFPTATTASGTIRGTYKFPGDIPRDVSGTWTARQAAK